MIQYIHALIPRSNIKEINDESKKQITNCRYLVFLSTVYKKNFKPKMCLEIIAVAILFAEAS